MKKKPNLPLPPAEIQPLSTPRPSRRFLLHRRHKALRYPLGQVRSFLRAAAAALPDPLPPGDIAIFFPPEQEMIDIHAVSFQDPSPTDVMTFPADEPDFCGEIVVSADCADRQAADHGTHFDEEMRLYLVHGLLHLSGMEDASAAGRKAMRQAETTVLSHPAVRSKETSFWLEKCSGKA